MEDNRYVYSTRTIRQFEAWRKDWEKTGETDIFKKIRHVIEFQGIAPEAKLEIIHYLAQQKIMAERDERTERQKQAYMNALLGKGADGENA